MKYFKIYAENGSCHFLPAKDKEDAIEQYYLSIESSIGHYLKICGCSDQEGNEVGPGKGIEKPIDRSKVARITKVEEQGLDKKKDTKYDMVIML